MMVTTVTKMEVRSEMTEVILNITLEIIHLLTGEDYSIVKKKSGECVTSSSYHNISGGWSRAQKLIIEESLPQSVIHEKNNNQKILDLTNKIIELLTGEVPIRCQDVTVHFSMEEWDYIEGHKDLYKDVMMENHQNLISAGRLPENTASHEQVSCFSSQSNYFSWSHLGNKLKRTARNVTPCEGESLKDIGNDAPPSQAQFPCTHIMEEAISCNGQTITDPNIYMLIDDKKQFPSPHIIEEQVSCDKENLTKPDIYTPSDPFLYIKEEPISSDEDLSEPNIYTLPNLQYSSPHIKEEPVSCDEEFSEPNRYTPQEDLQYPSPHIKEEPVSCDEDFSEPNCHTPPDDDDHYPSHLKNEPVSCDEEDLTRPNTYAPTHHLQYPSPHIKEESVSCDEEDLKRPNIYTPTEHLQYASHVKEEPVSCDDSSRYSPTNYTQQHQYAYIKMEPNCHIEGNITHPDIYTRKDHAQYQSTIKEEPISCGSRNITYCDSYTATDRIQQHPTTHIKEELVPSDVRDFTDPKKYHTQYESTHVKEEPVSCRSNVKHLFPQSPKEPVTSQLGYHKETDLYTSTSHTKNFPSTCVKDEIAGQHSPTLGCTDVKTESSSSPMKVIVLAHLVDIESTKSGITNSKHYNSQNEECVASTSYRGKYIKEARLSFRNRPNSVKTSEASHTFGDISNLTKYSRIHSKKKTLQCSECGQYFLRKLQLEAHIRMHAKQKSFQCSDCGKYYLDNVQLLDMKKDPEETNYKCPVCMKRLENEPNHLTRNKNHKVEKPFQCPECGKCFSIYYELFIHKKNHMKDSNK